MQSGFNIFRKLENGEERQIAWRPNRQLAERLVKDLQGSEPGDYGFREEVSTPLAYVTCVIWPRQYFGPN